MANTVFKLRRSSVAGKVPNTSTLTIGELGLNLTDQILYSSDGTSVFEIGANTRNSHVVNTFYVGNSSVNTFINATSLSVGNATVNAVIFANAGITATSGVLTWNPDESTLDLGLAGNNTTLQLGQETLYRVRNATGSTILNGTVVMANGTIGNSGRIKVTPAVANGSVPSHYIMGIATENITNGSDGYVTHFGKVRGINTTAWPDGTILYADPANTGGLTSTKPAAPNHKTIVAIVVHSHNNGTLFVRPTFGSDLADDERVELTSLANGDMLVYSSANGRFENTKDLTIRSVTANNTKGSFGQVLTTNGSSVYWSTVSGGGSGTGLLDTRQQYVGDGVTNTFTVTGGYQANSLSVYLNGVLLRNGSEVDVTGGLDFSFSTPPANGALIDVVGISTYYSNGTATVVSQQYTANGTANSFIVPGGYIANNIQVFLNGVKQINGTDVITTSGTTIDFQQTPANGFVVDVFGYQQSVLLVGGTYTYGNGTVNTTITAGSITVNGLAVATNNDLSANLANYLPLGGGTLTGDLYHAYGTYAIFLDSANNVGARSVQMVMESGNNFVTYYGNSSATYHQSNGNFGVGDFSSPSRFLVSANGNVGIGNTTPGHNLSVNGTIYTQNGYIYQLADTSSPAIYSKNDGSGYGAAIYSNTGQGLYISSKRLGEASILDARYYSNPVLTAGGNSTSNLFVTVGTSTPQPGYTFTVSGNSYLNGDTTITGNLIVTGTTVTVNTATLDVKDLNITVAKGAADAATANGAGLTVDGANANWIYNNVGNTWQSNVNISTSNSIAQTNITPTSIFMGNSTVNCVINSTSVYVNGIDYNPTTALAIAVALS